MGVVEHITIEGAPDPIAPFSHACSAGHLVFLTGQMPIDPNSGELVAGEIETQTIRVMENLKIVLNGMGLDLSDVVSARAFLTDMGDYEAFNSTYRSFFDPDKLPARTCIGVVGLALGAKVEVDFIASKDK